MMNDYNIVAMCTEIFFFVLSHENLFVSSSSSEVRTETPKRTDYLIVPHGLHRLHTNNLVVRVGKAKGKM